MIRCVGIVVCATPNVMYFRNHNMDHSSTLAVSQDGSSVRLNEWDTTINLFDTKKDVTVQRIDITGSPNATVELFSKSLPLVLSEGPIYIFHNATQLQITDPVGKNYSAAKTDAVIWISKGSCVHMRIQLSSVGEASLVAVTSGTVDWAASPHLSESCGQTTVLVGAGTRKTGSTSNALKFPPSSGWIYNEVQYTLANPTSCTNPLQHGQNGYSQTDEPIGPLAAHYHTRGALYYNQYGTSKYNDEAAPHDTLYQGELRFVNTGVYYGPEEMDQLTTFVASVHEADPVAVEPVGQGPSSECPFACMNTLGSDNPARCTKSTEMVV